MLKIDLNCYNITDDYIVIGVSSGPDSMALLHYIKNNLNKNIVCAHVNHNVRKESNEEELYLKNYCKNNNIIFETYKIDIYNENNFENEARKKRYTFYKSLLKKYNTKYLFLAHHGDDLTETILMKIIRGSNLEGYAGIRKINNVNNYYIIRPLLEYTKEDLIDYCKNNNIKYYIDNTNEDTTYTRNRIRKNILPLLKNENENIHTSFLKYSNTLLEYFDYIENFINNILDGIYINNILNLDEFNLLHPFIKKNSIYQILTIIYNNKPDIITNKHVNNILNLIDNSKPNLTLNLPKNKIVIKEYNKLIFDNIIEKKDNYKFELKDYNITFNHIIKKIDSTTSNGNDIIRLNSDNLKKPLYIRNKTDGDIIKVKGLNGTKKVKDIFINSKIPTSIRNSYPLLVDCDSNVLWIPNLKKSIFDKKSNEKYDIILKYCEKEDLNEK